MKERKEENDPKSKADEIQDASTITATKESDHEVATQKSSSVEAHFLSSFTSMAINSSTNAYSSIWECARAILRCLGFGKVQQRQKPLSFHDRPQDQETQPSSSSTMSGSTVSETEATADTAAATTSANVNADTHQQEREPKPTDLVDVSSTTYDADEPGDIIPSSSHPIEEAEISESTITIRMPSKPEVRKGKGPQTN